MRNRWSTLGTLFAIWGLLQLAALGAALAWSEERTTPWTLLSTVAIAAIYLVGGALTRHFGRRVWLLAVLLSALALVGFPLGTALGIYGLWVVLADRQPQWRTPTRTGG